MKIKLLKDAIGPRGNCGAGCIVDFPNEVARDLIDAGKAEAVNFYDGINPIEEALSQEQEIVHPKKKSKSKYHAEPDDGV